MWPVATAVSREAPLSLGFRAAQNVISVPPFLCQVFCTVIAMLIGALLGTTCLALNPFAGDRDFDEDDDSWLFVPAAVALYLVLCTHGRASAPSGGWQKALSEPLVPYGGPARP